MSNLIWVVDDDVSIGWVLEKALQKKGYQVAVFRGVKPLLLALKMGSPEVVISDIQMPGVDGLKLLDLLGESFPHIPVIIMTAYSDYQTTISSYKKGAFEYLAKPFDINYVMEMVGQALKLKQQNQVNNNSRPSWHLALEKHIETLCKREQQEIASTLQREIDEILIRVALKQTQGHKQNAAKLLGWGRNTLTRKIQELGLRFL